MKKQYCENCKYFISGYVGVMTEPCRIHPFYDRNRNGDCKDYKRIWWKIWVKNEYTKNWR